MRLTLATETGDIHTVDVPADMSLADLISLAASSFPGITRNGTLIPTLKCNGRDLPGSPQTLMQAGIKNDDLIVVVRPAAPAAAAAAGAGRPTRPPTRPGGGAPMMMGGAGGAGQQQQTPAQMQAAVNQFFASMQQMMVANNTPEGRAEMERQRQRAEKQRAIDENLAIAMEHTPEAFGRVIMLYIDGKVNGHTIKAFVDSGAQSTIMSHKLAQACGLDHLIDDRFAGMAQGVGTAKILGRVHAAQLEVGGGTTGTPPLFLMCSFTILESDNNGVDMLFGLDMLKRHQASIDLAENVLKIQGQKIPFLAEHELPEQAKDRVKEELARAKEEADRAAQAVSSPSSSQQAGSASAAAAAAPAPGLAPATDPLTWSAAPGTPGPAAQPAASNLNEGAIQTLMAMGVSRAEAIQALMAAGGSVDLAASLLFN